MSNQLTWRQSEMLDFIRDNITKRGIAPTYAEISDHFDCCESVCCRIVGILVRKGYLHRVKGISRGLTLTASGARMVELPQIHDEEYWYEGVFKPQLYWRDVVDVVEAAGLKVKESA